jgi:hypothetical protein
MRYDACATGDGIKGDQQPYKGAHVTTAAGRFICRLPKRVRESVRRVEPPLVVLEIVYVLICDIFGVLGKRCGQRTCWYRTS